MNKDSLELLRQMIDIASPSGFEMGIQHIIRSHMQSCCDEVRTDVHGNVIGILNTSSPWRIMLAGHCDEIGMMVIHVDEKGFIYINMVGGLDISMLLGQRIIIHSSKGEVPGVIGRKPIHLIHGTDELSKPPKIHEIWIDIGAKNRKDALRVIDIGDYVTIDCNLTNLGNNLVAGRAFDDRLGAFIVVETMRRMKKHKSSIGIYGVSTVQEEIGLRGAKTSAYGIDPHAGIAVEVGFATDCPGMDPKTIGISALGKGPVLHRGPNINPKLGRLIEETARKRKIKFQIMADSRPTGTDANAIQVNRAGSATALISVPTRYIHTPVEVISLDDVDETIHLLVEVLCAMKPGMDFIPGRK